MAPVRLDLCARAIELFNRVFERFIMHDFVLVTIDGEGCVMTVREAIDHAECHDRDCTEYAYEIVPMTWSEYEAMGEFDGW